jgi:hypothetical protein
MATLQPNVVQAEFFHVGGDTNASLEDVMAECWSRAGDGLRDILAGADPKTIGTGIKTCVRFYDADWSMTNFVKHAQEIDEHLALLPIISESRGFRRMLLRRKFKFLIHEITSIEPRKLALAIKELGESLKKIQPVAIERVDKEGNRLFRPLRKDENHELLEAVRSSKHVWLFLFKHNDLLAETNVGAGHSM